MRLIVIQDAYSLDLFVNKSMNKNKSNFKKIQFIHMLSPNFAHYFAHQQVLAVFWRRK